MKVIVKLEHVSKYFVKDKYIVKDLSLEVYEGEFLTLLGSSGCGKTTILRLISGLDYVTSGKVYIDSIDVTNLDPTKREVNTIFQNFALFPHMNVFENVSFGLKMKKVPKNEIDKRVTNVLKLVKLTGFEDRLPSQLSGGQQQRVAIARGIVMNPKVLLMDESLCSLDLKLKRSMEIELKRLQKKLGITVIYVTHDQDEALTMSDRIIIFDKGKIQQDDTPENIYRNPLTTYVADFIGESNILHGIINKIDDFTNVLAADFNFKIQKDDNDKKGDKVDIIIRPEDIKLSGSELKNGVLGTIDEIIYDGAISKLFVSVKNEFTFRVNIQGIINFKENDQVYLKFNENSIIAIRGNKNEKR